MSSSNHQVQRIHLERLRLSSPPMIQVLIQDVVRQHIERIEPATLADLFALAEADLPARLHAELAQWASRARREIADLPQGQHRMHFVAEVSELPPESVPTAMREAVLALANGASAEIAGGLEELRVRWEQVAPEPVKVAAPPPKGVAAPQGIVERAIATKTVQARPARAAKTPAAMVDPRRAEWIRGDALARLGSREYAERGLKESIFVAGIKHRSPYKDMTVEEIMTELRKLERERKLKHTGERWMAR